MFRLLYSSFLCGSLRSNIGAILVLINWGTLFSDYLALGTLKEKKKGKRVPLGNLVYIISESRLYYGAKTTPECQCGPYNPKALRECRININIQTNSNSTRTKETM